VNVTEDTELELTGIDIPSQSSQSSHVWLRSLVYPLMQAAFVVQGHVFPR
jgi:hypothetical protein